MTVRVALLLMLALMTFPALASAQAGSRILRTEAVINATPEELWKAYTTKEGLETWMVPLAEVDLRIGGTIRTNYDAAAGPRGPGSIVYYILAYEPNRMIATKFLAPGNDSMTKVSEATWTVTTLEPVSPTRTRVTTVMIGWGDGPDWDKPYETFRRSNEQAMQQLQQRFEHPTEAAQREATFKLLGSLIGGEWTARTVAPDGKALRIRTIVEAGPDGNCLVTRGWISDGSDEFLHSSAQIWREPGDGRVMFQDVNQNGDIARGEIRATDASSLTWDWSVCAADGSRRSYEVVMKFEGPDSYQGVLTEKLPSGPKEVLSTRYARTRTAPAQPAPSNLPPPAAPSPPRAGIDTSLFVASGLVEPGLSKDVLVHASPSDVFRAWTTSEGLKSFLGVESKVDLRIGGAYELYFSGADQPQELRGSNGCQILSYVPDQMLSFSWNAPPKFPEERSRRAWVVVTLTKEGDSTRVRLVHTGFGLGGNWNEVRQYFDRAWTNVLAALQERFK